MKLFIRDGVIIAQHKNDQDVDGSYPDTELVIVPDSLTLSFVNPDLPTTYADPRPNLSTKELAKIVKLTEDYYDKTIAINTEFPTWAEIDTFLTGLEDDVNAMANMADAKAVLVKLMTILRKDVRITYWLAKGTKT